MVDRRRTILRWSVSLLAYGVVAAVAALPLVAERAIEAASFRDRIGTFPVEVALSHNGTSTLDTGVLGKLYWDQTGAAGFGVRMSSTGPPAAGGTLSSYVTPTFLRANVAFVEDPDEVADLYAVELRARVLDALIRYEVAAAVGGGLLLTLLFRGCAPPVPSAWGSRVGRPALRAGYLLVLLALSSGVAWQFFGDWEGSRPVGARHPMPGEPHLAFSSPQTLEVAQQIRPFVEKNTRRIEERTQGFVTASTADLEARLPEHATSLTPKEGERIVISEADSQGSLVAAKVRRALYPVLQELVGADAIVLRTISGDLTSNGTVAERDYVSDEVHASPGIPTVVVKGDHDTATTVEQLHDEGVTTPDLDLHEVGGITVTGAADPAFKALFGGLVQNPSGVTEAELGRALRDVVADRAPLPGLDVVLHQPRAAAAYLGIGSTGELADAVGHETVPYDDGVPDVPAGMVNVGHLHDASGPWVIWNTDTDQITWTVVSQLGTSGGVEENPTFNRFSTPFSTPLKAISVRLSYINPATGLQTGYASVVIAPDGTVSVEDRVDVGLPGGEPGTAD